MARERLIVAITGASGAIFGVRALEILRSVPDVETHLILSPSAVRTLVDETDWTADEVRALADHVHSYRDIGASISSGSYRTAGMLVAPCSIKTLSGIANCYNDELVVRAADVCLKERRRVVLMLRETPLHAGHIALMDQANRNGAIIMPPVPAFYHRPQSVDDIVNQTVGRALDLFGIDAGIVHRWKESPARPTPTAAKPANDAPHWRFSLDVYARPGVAPSCLLLQDRCGVDVNILLLALYAAVRLNAVIEARDIARLDEAVTRFRDVAVVPLRSVRRAMKEAGFGEAAEGVRNRVKSAELMAEQLEQAFLAELLPTPSMSGSGSDPDSVALAVAAHFARGQALDGDIRAAAALVAQAASAEQRVQV